MKRRLLLLTAMASLIFLLIAGPAFGEISKGSCEATVSTNLRQTPVNVRSVSSTNKAHAVPVTWDGSVTAGATTPGLAGAYRVELEFFGFRWKVADGTGSGNSWSRTAQVKPYAIYGTGYYRVHGVTDTPLCDGAVLINIIGKKPLSTAGGLVSLGLSVIGTVGMVVTSIACGFGRGMGIPKTQLIPETSIDTEWRNVKTPGRYVHWCGTAARHTPPPVIRNICGNPLFQEGMADVLRGG